MDTRRDDEDETNEDETNEDETNEAQLDMPLASQYYAFSVGAVRPRAAPPPA